VTTLCAPFLIVPTSWDDYIKSLFGALTFTANIFLWLQTGYFEQASAFKQLLHLWSLSIEEQYYLILPLFLLIAPTRWRIIVIIAALLSSAALCILLVPHKPSATFFLLPTRVWELMIGSFLAVIVAKRPNLDAPAVLKVAATAIIFLIPFLPLDQLHPRFDAVLITCATAVLLTVRGEWLPRWPITRALSLAGDWSYSIYLVHWPLYALATNAFLGQIPTTVALLLIPISFALVYLQYRYVEQRLRFICPDNNSLYLRYIMAASLVVSFPVLLYSFGATRSASSKIDFAWLRRVNFGLDQACGYVCDFDNRPQCKLAGDPRVALWGDSFAMHWAAGLADALHGKGLIQITKSMCAPVEQLAVTFPGGQITREWAETCIQFNKSALHYIVTTDSIKTVVLSAAWGVYMNPSNFVIGDRVAKPDTRTLERQFLATLSALRTTQKNVIVIAPLPHPANNINIGECLERKAQGVFVYPLLRTDCSFSYDDYQAAWSSEIKFLRKIAELDDINIVRPESVTCDNKICAAQIEGTPLYRDTGHITYDASLLLTRMLRIADMLELPLQRRANAVEPNPSAP
jgi:peptidoglycan/LPS O-acetylase OafA/YrhL